MWGQNPVPPPDDDKNGFDKQSKDDDKAQEDESEVHLPIELPLELLNSLPDEVRRVVLQAASFSGPLPPSPMFREYEDVLAGAGDRIIGMAETQATHRQEWEKTALRSAQTGLARGQWLGFAISVAALGAATYLAMQGLLAMPIIFGGAGVIGLVANFINTVRHRQADDDD